MNWSTTNAMHPVSNTLIMKVDARSLIYKSEERRKNPQCPSNMTPYSVTVSYSPKHSFRLPALRGLEEEHLLAHNRVVFQHTQRPVCSWPDHGSIETRHGHRDESNGYCSRLCCRVLSIIIKGRQEVEVAYPSLPL